MIILGLTYIATHPKYQRRGTAKMLTKWGLDRCRREKIPAYLESTLVAKALYEELGFESKEKISITFEDGSMYEEYGCVFQP